MGSICWFAADVAQVLNALWFATRYYPGPYAQGFQDALNALARSFGVEEQVKFDQATAQIRLPEPAALHYQEK